MDADGKSVVRRSFDEYVSDVFRFAGYIRATEAEPAGRHFDVLADNSYHYAVCIGGVLCAGGVLTLLNQLESVDNIVYQIDFADVSRIFADANNLERVRSFCAETGVALSGIEDYRACPDAEPTDGGDDLERLSVLLFTSGSSGRSKCVMLSGRNLFFSMDGYSDFFFDVLGMSVYNQKRYFAVLPLCHIVSFITVMADLHSGCLISLPQINKVFRDMEILKSDYIFVVPAIMNVLFAMISKCDRIGELSYVFCGGASIKAEQIQAFEDKGIHVVPAYGLSETCGTGTQNPYYILGKSSSIGRSYVAGVQIRFDCGELCISGDSVMMGYYKDPAATAEAIRDGWLHTGDLGYMDADGDIFLTGRKKNLIILSNGENVSPEELEGKLLQNPMIKEALVKEKGDAICAVLYCGENEREGVSAFIAELNKALPLFKQITEIEFRTEPLPRTANGKIKRA